MVRMHAARSVAYYVALTLVCMLTSWDDATICDTECTVIEPELNGNLILTADTADRRAPASCVIIKIASIFGH